MTQVEIRLAEIYSYYVDERYLDDLSCSFAEWLASSMYSEEANAIVAALFQAVHVAEKEMR